MEHSPDGGFWVRAWVFVQSLQLGERGTPLRNRYEAALAALPESTRQVLLAHRVDGLDYVTIAGRFDISVGDVESRIADALRAISNALDDD